MINRLNIINKINFSTFLIDVIGFEGDVIINYIWLNNN
jgi:hypothetical protein